MMNTEAINKIDDYLSYDFHFTDYEFGGMNDGTGEKAPRPEKTEWLTEQFTSLMLRLKDFLITDPDANLLAKFITTELDKVNSEEYLKKEYRILVCKYHEIPMWLLGCNAAYKYLENHEDELKYST